MKINHLLSVLAVLGLVMAFGCSSTPSTAPAPAEITVESLATLLPKANAVSVFDANGDDTRKEFGVIPGAKLLTNYSDFDLAVLPAAKEHKLVFYCSNERCAAAPKAAGRAMEAGYKDVNVLKVGIKGWAKAGQKTDKPKG